MVRCMVNSNPPIHYGFQTSVGTSPSDHPPSPKWPLIRCGCSREPCNMVLWSSSFPLLPCPVSSQDTPCTLVCPADPLLLRVWILLVLEGICVTVTHGTLGVLRQALPATVACKLDLRTFG